MQLVLGRLAATQSATPLTLSPFVDRPFFTDLLLPHNFGRPGSAARAAALKSGRRPRGRSPWHCRRPSVVTEGYIRLPPLPPTTSYLPRTYLCPIPVHPRSTIIPVIYSVFCVRCSKNIVFYSVLWPWPSPGFILATSKNHGFFMVLGLRKGSGTENWPS